MPSVSSGVGGSAVCSLRQPTDWNEDEIRRQSRQRLSALDACLHEIENELEGDHVRVSFELAGRIRAHVPAVMPDMLLTRAMDRVFQAQEQHLSSLRGWTEPGEAPARAGGTPLNEVEARILTDEIRNTSRQVCVLLLEAHDRYAWSALGYTTWEQYVRQELGLSRTRSYELLSQGRVVVSIQKAATLPEMPDISAYAAEQIKPYLSEVIEALRVRTDSLPLSERGAVIADVVREFRALWPRRSGAERRDRQVGPREVAGDRCLEVRDLCGAIDHLAAMPPPEQVAAGMSEEHLRQLQNIEVAADWLARFKGCQQALMGGPTSTATTHT